LRDAIDSKQQQRCLRYDANQQIRFTIIHNDHPTEMFLHVAHARPMHSHPPIIGTAGNSIRTKTSPVEKKLQMPPVTRSTAGPEAAGL
jgi:hypothetical protein